MRGVWLETMSLELKDRHMLIWTAVLGQQATPGCMFPATAIQVP